MSVNRRYGCGDARVRVGRSSTRSPSQGAGSTYKVFTAAAALEEGYSEYYTISTTADPYTLAGLQGRPGPTPVRRARNAGNYPATLDMERALVRVVQHVLPGAGGRARQRRGAGAHGRADGHALRPANQTPADQIIAENRGSFTFGADATSPLDLASAYSTLGGQRHPVRPDAGRRRSSTANGAAADRRRRRSRVVTDDNCTPEAIPPGVATTLNQMLRGTSSPAPAADRHPGLRSPATRSPARPGRRRTTTRSPSSATRPQYTASVMVLQPQARTRTSAASVAARAPRSGTTRWRRS